MKIMDKEDLGLSLSLSSFNAGAGAGVSTSSYCQSTIQPFPFSCNNQKLQSTDILIHHSEERPKFLDDSTAAETRPLLRGIDVNRAPETTETAAWAQERETSEEEAGASSSPDSSVSILSGGKRTASERDAAAAAGRSEEQDAERASSRGVSDEEDGDGSRKKLRLSKDQSAILEETFKDHNTLNPKQKLALAKQLHLRPRQVEVWFQNRRARTKLKQTEVDCEFLKKCCENLTEENRRLQKEVQDLRSLKLPPSPFFMHAAAPPAALTMCPSCERVSDSGGAAPRAAPELRHPYVFLHYHHLHHAPVPLRRPYLDAPTAPPRS